MYLTLRTIELTFDFFFNFQLLQDRADKICEMANVMQKSIQIDDENLAKEQELLARLITENKVRNSLQTDIYIVSSF